MRLYFVWITMFSNKLSKELATLKWRDEGKQLTLQQHPEQRAKHSCVWKKSVHTSESISSFNICERLENHSQRQAKKVGKRSFIFIFSFSSYHGALRPLPVVSPGLAETLSQTNTRLPRGVCSPRGCGGSILLTNSGKTSGSEVQLEIFEPCRAAQHSRGWEQQPLPSLSCCSAPLLLLPLVVPAEVV